MLGLKEPLLLVGLGRDLVEIEGLGVYTPIFIM